MQLASDSLSWQWSGEDGVLPSPAELPSVPKWCTTILAARSKDCTTTPRHLLHAKIFQQNHASFTFTINWQGNALQADLKIGNTTKNLLIWNRNIVSGSIHSYYTGSSCIKIWQCLRLSSSIFRMMKIQLTCFGRKTTPSPRALSFAEASLWGDKFNVTSQGFASRNNQRLKRLVNAKKWNLKYAFHVGKFAPKS